MTNPNCVFIYSNLKVSPFIPADKPYPGFELITYDNESYTYGTLWNIGKDAGYSRIGKGFVYGQLWRIIDYGKLEELVEFTGTKQGTTEQIIVPVAIQIKHYQIDTKINAITFCLTQIQKSYNIISDGCWMIQRE